MKLHLNHKSDDSEVWMFWCPGCNCAHGIRVRGNRSWQWNGDTEKPTFSPSVLATGKTTRCHSYVKDGAIQFLGDCDHELRGQKVQLPDWTYDD